MNSRILLRTILAASAIFLPHSGRTADRGELLSKLDEIYTDKNEPNLSRRCDIKYKSMKYELAQALDDREEAIAAFATKNVLTNSATVEATIGPFTIYKADDPPSHSLKWERDIKRTWFELYTEYHRIKDQPINNDWLYLNRSVHSYLLMDGYRALHDNMSITPETIPFLRELLVKVKACLLLNCQKFNLAEEAPWTVDDYFYSGFEEDLRKTVQNDDRVKYAELLASLYRRLDNDLSWLKPRPNPDIVVTSDGALHVRMSDFAGVDDLNKLTEYMTAPWKAAGLKIEVEWLPSSGGLLNKSLELFLIPVGNRNSVDVNNGYMRLAPYLEHGVLPHEFGHVLGLKDEYLDTFDYKTCGYSYYYKPGSLMSDHPTGAVLPEHIRQIKALYNLDSPMQSQPAATP